MKETAWNFIRRCKLIWFKGGGGLFFPVVFFFKPTAELKFNDAFCIDDSCSEEQLSPSLLENNLLKSYSKV